MIEPEAQASGTIAQARLRIYGTTAYPDASGTLRLSYGKVDGLTHGGKSIGPFTTIGGLYQHATGHDPYKLGAVDIVDSAGARTLIQGFLLEADLGARRSDGAGVGDHRCAAAA